MPCVEAQALISAAHDGEPVAELELAAAQSHCDECAECRAFRAGLRYLDLLPVAPAPDGLVERVMAAIAPLADERDAMRIFASANAEAPSTESEAVGVETPLSQEAAPARPEPPVVEPSFDTPATPSGGFSWFVGPMRWATLGAAGALAATALVAFVVVGLGGQPVSETRTTAGGESAPALDLGFGDAGQNAAAPAAPVSTPAPAQAPDYVVYNDYVYAPGALLADAASATPTIGALSTAFASPGAPQSVTVYRSPLTDGSIVLRGPDGLRVFTPVQRMMSSIRFQLTSGQPIDRFGVWPVLPDRFPIPASSAGTPSFVTAGVDAIGVGVFSATGRPVTEGFAIAPGTSSADPAGGNPNWTWWAPAPANP